MNTILTDDDIALLPGLTVREIARSAEAAVLAKLREQEPVAWRYRFHTDTSLAGGANTRKWGLIDTKPPSSAGDLEVQPLSAAPLPAVVQVPPGYKLVPVEPTDEWKSRLRDIGYNSRNVIEQVLAAAPEAPAQGPSAEEQWRVIFDAAWMSLTPQQREAALADTEAHHPLIAACQQAAQAIPAPWREAVKVARDKFIGSGDFQELAYEHADAALKASGSYALFEFTPDQLDRFFRAALAQLDALKGGE